MLILNTISFLHRSTPIPDMQAALQGHCCQLVHLREGHPGPCVPRGHLDIPPVPLEATDPVAHIGITEEAQCPQVPNLHVSVVVSSRYLGRKRRRRTEGNKVASWTFVASSPIVCL